MDIHTIIKAIRSELGLSQGEFAAKLGMNRSNYSHAEGGRSKLSVEQLNELAKNFSIDMNVFIEMLNSGEKLLPILLPKLLPKGEKKEKKGDNESVLKVNPKSIENTPERHIFTSDKIKTIEIPILDVSAAAGYGFLNPDYVEQLGTINLPSTMFSKEGLRYCIRNRGFSMAPTIQDSDLLIIRHVPNDEWHKIPDEHVYFVVDKDGLSFTKRVKNRLNKGFIVLTSDSIEKASYPNFNLQADEISNIFYAEWHFSARMQNINETYYSRLKLLEDAFDDMKNEIGSLGRKLKE